MTVVSGDYCVNHCLNPMEVALLCAKTHPGSTLSMAGGDVIVTVPTPAGGFSYIFCNCHLVDDRPRVWLSPTLQRKQRERWDRGTAPVIQVLR